VSLNSLSEVGVVSIFTCKSRNSVCAVAKNGCEASFAHQIN